MKTVDGSTLSGVSHQFTSFPEAAWTKDPCRIVFCVLFSVFPAWSQSKVLKELPRQQAELLQQEISRVVNKAVAKLDVLTSWLKTYLISHISCARHRSFSSFPFEMEVEWYKIKRYFKVNESNPKEMRNKVCSRNNTLQSSAYHIQCAFQIFVPISIASFTKLWT